MANTEIKELSKYNDVKTVVLVAPQKNSMVSNPIEANYQIVNETFVHIRKAEKIGVGIKSGIDNLIWLEKITKFEHAFLSLAQELLQNKSVLTEVKTIEGIGKTDIISDIDFEQTPESDLYLSLSSPSSMKKVWTK
uniref:Pyruvate kinase n=1 Tax=Rhabditophanes sp. KR3021 TaxID=114890 RepID=A0AC35TXZ7_9BILA